jgi:imidazolonepropionase-like amidohydrolase
MEAFMKKELLILITITSILLLTECRKSIDSPDSSVHPIALVNGTLIDGTGDQPLQDAIIIINDGRITEVGTRATLSIPDGSVLIDIQGGTILPGFINSHVHGAYYEQLLRTWAQAGVTTVRDLAASPPKTSYTLRDELNKNPMNARFIASGPQMTAVNGFVPSNYTASVFISSPEVGIREANRILDEGADLLKVMMESNWGYPNMPVEIARAIIETAHQRGKKASVHVSLCRDVERALLIGTDDLAHMVIDKLSPELAKKVSDAGIIWIPTMEVWKGAGFGGLVVSNLRTFVEAGGKVALGTDYNGAAFEIGMPMKELGWMQEAGMTSMQIIVASTKNAAKACGLSLEIGTIQAGKNADLFVVPGNPLTNLDVLADAQWVIHSGIIIKKK